MNARRILVTLFLAACADDTDDDLDAGSREAGVIDAAIDARTLDASLDARTLDASSDASVWGRSPAAGLGADPSIGDPGRPATLYGPKADLDLYVGDVKVGYAFFTALGDNVPTRAHVFGDLAPLGSENVAEFYLSLVMDDEPWKVASYVGAQGGRVRVTLEDGRSYAGNAGDLNVELTTREVGVGPSDDVYLRATLTLMVPSTQPGAAPLRLDGKINTL